MKPQRNPDDVLRAFIAQYHTQKQAAAALGVGAAYVSELLHGRRLFSDAMLERLGLERIVIQSKAS